MSDRITAAAEPMAHAHPLYVPPPYQDSVEAGRLILRDGSTAFIRIAQPADREPLREFFGRLSPESQQQRSFSLAAPGGEWLSTLCDASNPRQQLTLVVLRTAGGNPRIMGLRAQAPDFLRLAEYGAMFQEEWSLTLSIKTTSCEFLRLYVYAGVKGYRARVDDERPHFSTL